MTRQNPHGDRNPKHKQQVPQVAAPTGTPPRQARTRTPNNSLSCERPQAFARLSQKERDAMDEAHVPQSASVPQEASTAGDRPSALDAMIESARGLPRVKSPAPNPRSRSRRTFIHGSTRYAARGGASPPPEPKSGKPLQASTSMRAVGVWSALSGCVRRDMLPRDGGGSAGQAGARQGEVNF